MFYPRIAKQLSASSDAGARGDDIVHKHYVPMSDRIDDAFLQAIAVLRVLATLILAQRFLKGYAAVFEHLQKSASEKRRDPLRHLV